MIDLIGKKLYSGSKEVSKVYLGSTSIYQKAGGYVAPFAHKLSYSMLYAYDFTQGLTDPYEVPYTGSTFLKPVTFTSVTPEYTGNSINLSGGSMQHNISTAANNTTSYYFSMTFDTNAARIGNLFYITTGGGNHAFRKDVSNGDVTCRVETKNGTGSGYGYSPIITTPQTTFDIYSVNGKNPIVWVNGVQLNFSSKTGNLSGSSSIFTMYGITNIYDYKVYLNPGANVFTDEIILQQYQNIQARLQNI